ncbi:MAG: sel1 repeat family protein [Magnetococcales bacterium]|nr:sel1 repeat family protein [Magnetococcales bacterium]
MAVVKSAHLLMVIILVAVHGPGCAQDDLGAIQRAADQGDAAAQSKLGGLYYLGQGVPQDYKKAAKWLHIAAAQGNVEAQGQLGMMYHEGQGVPHDNAEAEKFLRKAAEQNDVTAQKNLAIMYTSGDGVPRNIQAAVKWFRRAADQGDAGAQRSLGNMYENGRGVPIDHVQAHMWYSLSAVQGDEDAIKRRDGIARRMTAAQIAQAQEIARKWKPATNGDQLHGQDKGAGAHRGVHDDR